MTHETSTRRVERALERLATGGIAIVVDDFNRENEGDFVAVSELATHETINFMATHGRGLICQPITTARAESLDLPAMADRNTDYNGTAFTVSVDHASCTTGISAYERAVTVRALVDPATTPPDLKRPGHIFPLVAQARGVFDRRGHTEASVDLARLAGFEPSGVICEIMNEDGSMARLPELEEVAERHDLPVLSVEDVVQYRDAIGDVHVRRHSTAELPTRNGDFRISTYTSEDPASGEIVLLESSRPPADGETPLVRLHSECLTGEAFASARCDCGPQLDTALERIGRDGGGLVYLKQEGRGIGLIEKIRAYALQDEGMDTVEANLALGHQADGRRFGAAAAVLREAGYSRVRLLTNNPEKVRAVEASGIVVVDREDLTVGITHANRPYLATKIAKFGHVIQGV